MARGLETCALDVGVDARKQAWKRLCSSTPVCFLARVGFTRRFLFYAGMVFGRGAAERDFLPRVKYSLYRNLYDAWLDSVSRATYTKGYFGAGFGRGGYRFC